MNVLIAQLIPGGPLSNFARLINQNMWVSGKAGEKGGELWSHESLDHKQEMFMPLYLALC